MPADIGSGWKVNRLVGRHVAGYVQTCRGSRDISAYSTYNGREIGEIEREAVYGRCRGASIAIRSSPSAALLASWVGVGCWKHLARG